MSGGSGPDLLAGPRGFVRPTRSAPAAHRRRHEYEEFARHFLSDRFEIEAVHSSAEARARLERGRDDPSHGVDALLVDLRFERAPTEDLVGDLPDLAKRMFAGDLERARRWAKDQQGTLILGELRKAGFRQRAVFVHDFPPDRLANLRKLYGDVHAVAGFDADAIARALAGASVAASTRGAGP